MKIRNLFCYGLTLLIIGGFSSCSQDETIEQTDNVLVPMTFTAGASKTRTQLVNGNAVYWTSGDNISVLDGNMGKNYKFSTTGSGMIAYFEGEAPNSDTYYAVYPYTANTFYIPYYQTISALSLSAQQQAVDGTFDTNLNLSWASTTSNDMMFQFHNISSLVKFKLTGDLLSEIKTVTLTDNGTTGLAYEEFEWNIENGTMGTRTKSPSPTITLNAPNNGFKSNTDYYFTFIPSQEVFQKGLTLAFCNADGQVLMTKTTNHAIETTSGKIYNIGSFEIKNEPEEGYEDVDGTWEIYNAKGLQAWADRINSGETYINAKLMKDIDLSNMEWKPVGSYENPYLGIFEGNSKKISGLTINYENKYTGLFAAIGKGSIVRNLTLTDININTQEGNAGSLAGFCCGTIENVNINNAEITGYTIGGVVGTLGSGQGETGIITGGTIDGNIILNGYSKSQYSAMRAGGVAGYVAYYGTTIQDVIVNADFTFTHQSADNRPFAAVGLIAGHLSLANIYHCQVILHKNVEVQAKYIGGIVGEAGQIGTIYGSSIVTGNRTPVSLISTRTDPYCNMGGIAGKMGYSSSITGCYASGVWLKGMSEDYNYIGGIISQMDDNCTIKACYFKGQIIKQEGSYYNKLGAILAIGPHVQFEECCWMSSTVGLNGTGETSSNIPAIGEVTDENQWNAYKDKMNKVLSKQPGDDRYQYEENSGENKDNVPLIIHKETMK